VRSRRNHYRKGYIWFAGLIRNQI